jgi:hypothetical protein
VAKATPVDFKVEFDDTDGGSLVNVTPYVRTINGVDVEGVLEESHPFGVAWFESLATGMKRMNDVEIGGFYDDAASPAPNAVFNDVADDPAAATRTLKLTWRGTKTTTVETRIMRYSRRAVTNELTKYAVTLRPTGAVTEA